MKFRVNLAVSLPLVVLLWAATGCAKDDVAASGGDYKFNKSALDMYMTDVPPPVVNVSVSSGEEYIESEKVANKTYKSFYGDWEAKIDMKEEMKKENAKRKADPNYDPKADEFAAAFASGMAEMMSFSLSIKEDKSFQMTMMFFPIEGKWHQKGDSLYLHPESVMGMSKEEMAKMAGPDGNAKMQNDEPLVLKISADGKTLTTVEAKGADSQEKLVFTRKA